MLIVAFIQMEVEGDELQRMRPVSASFSPLTVSSLYLSGVPSPLSSAAVLLSFPKWLEGSVSMIQQQ